MRIIVLLIMLTCCLLQAFSKEPADITFVVSLTKHPAVYHLGERIVCKLSLSARSAGKYNFTVFGEPRSGPASQYRFSAMPGDSAADPHVNLGQLGIVTVGGQLFSCYKLSAVPVTLETDLNEWLRFKKPGHYQLQVGSSEVFLDHGACRIPPPAEKITVDSNSIDITILPADKEWASAELQGIVAVLNSPSINFDENKTEAARRLRYLNTAAAASQMVEELSGTLGQPWHYDLYEGLLESSWRSKAISALEQTIQNPHNRVSYDAVELLSMLVLLRECCSKPLPDAGRNHPAQFQTLRAALRHRVDRRTALWAKYTAELSSSVSERTGRARGDAIFALWKSAESHYYYKQAVPPTLGMLRQEIVSIAEDLTPEQQLWLVSIYWAGLPKDKLMPCVKKIATSPSPITIPSEGDLRKLALSRWCEAEPTNCKHS